MKNFKEAMKDQKTQKICALYIGAASLATLGAISWSSAFMLTLIAKPIYDLGHAAYEKSFDKFQESTNSRNIIALSLAFMFGGSGCALLFSALSVLKSNELISFHQNDNNSDKKFSNDGLFHNSLTNQVNELVKPCSALVQPKLEEFKEKAFAIFSNIALFK